MAKRVNVLSIDGGGIRGIIPALILQEIQQQLGRPLHQAFDLIAGTSTGGIIALAIGTRCKNGAPFEPAELADMYVDNAGRIFNKSFFSSVKELMGPKYPAEGIETVLQEKFSDTMFSTALTNLLISSYDVQTQLPFFFKSSRIAKDPAWDWPIWKIARATSAAPTFFPPFHLTRPPQDDYALVDGGVFVNNPAMAAYAEARALFPSATEFNVVSVGTGDRRDGISYSQCKGWGLLGWARHIPSVMMDSVSEAIDYELDQIVGATAGCKHHRLQPMLDFAAPEMDNIHSENLERLREGTAAYITANAALISQVCRDVSSAFGASA